MSYKKVQQYIAEDGTIFSTVQEVKAYERKDAILEALGELTNNKKIVDLLFENMGTVKDMFKIGGMKRVKKAERNRLAKALEYVAELDKAESTKKLEFLVMYTDAIVSSFKWETTTRLTEEETAKLITDQVKEIGGNAKVAAWIITNKDDILKAFKAGLEISEGLRKHQEKMAEERAALQKAGGAKSAKVVDEEEEEEDDFDESLDSLD